MAARFAIFAIRVYQATAGAWLGGHCRFYPSCSEYARRCFAGLPWFTALGLSLRRIFQCHPWHAGGVDLPPADADRF